MDKVQKHNSFNRIIWVRHVARVGGMRKADIILVGGSEGRRPLGRPRRKWEDNIIMDLEKIVCEGVDWMHLAWQPVEGCCEHGNEPVGSIKGGEFLDYLRDY
jgi:hypothetical protein